MTRRLLTLVCILTLLLMVLPPVRAQDGGPATHVVQLDENLYRISLHYNVTMDDLMRANNLWDANLVVVGQVLIIPGVVSPPAPVTPDPVAASIGADLGITGADVPAAPEAPPGNALQPDLGIIPSGAESAPAAVSEMPVAAPEESAPSEAPAPVPEIVEPPADSEPSVPESAPPADLHQPDLGIISAGAANWMLQPGIISTGDAATVRAIYRRGQELGNDPHAFSKIGDCNSEPPFFLAKFDKGEYILGPYADLQPVIEQFAGSYIRESITVWTGNHAWAVFDATWANPAFCQPGETPIACEFRLHRPSLALIRLGTNEAGTPDTMFEESLRKIIDYSIEQGVIPVLGTKADRLEGSDRHNEIVRALAAEYGVPLWDFGRIADTLPDRGLMADGFHLTYVPPDYTAPYALSTGHSVQNLVALMALNTVWRNVMH